MAACSKPLTGERQEICKASGFQRRASAQTCAVIFSLILVLSIVTPKAKLDSGRVAAYTDNDF
jgi:hypothetical protein